MLVEACSGNDLDEDMVESLKAWGGNSGEQMYDLGIFEVMKTNGSRSPFL